MSEQGTPVEVRKGNVDPRRADYRPATDLARTCGLCAHFQPEWNGCSLVAGTIRPDYVSDLWEPAPSLGEVRSSIALAATAKVAKADDDTQTVFGWAYVAITKDGTQVTDHSGEFVATPEELEEAAYDFVLVSGLSGDRHEADRVVGKMVESVVFTKAKAAAMGLPEGSAPHAGWWVGFHLPDRADYDLVKSGERAMFSIEGSAVKEDADA